MCRCFHDQILLWCSGFRVALGVDGNVMWSRRWRPTVSFFPWLPRPLCRPSCCCCCCCQTSLCDLDTAVALNPVRHSIKFTLGVNLMEWSLRWSQHSVVEGPELPLSCYEIANFLKVHCYLTLCSWWLNLIESESFSEWRPHITASQVLFHIIFPPCVHPVNVVSFWQVVANTGLNIQFSDSVLIDSSSPDVQDVKLKN